MGTTEKIAQFIVDISLEKIPRDVVDKAKRTVLDCIGAALAGVSEPVSQTIIGYATNSADRRKHPSSLRA
jgi:2-methylcitrate dehydratase PrpD